ncbi:secreted protein [sediment metagenome]|uniref:Secreted protein n=1 Tax=sediment metagenome TaxID=749907 RepID=D9PKH8_9ZZZZ
MKCGAWQTGVIAFGLIFTANAQQQINVLWIGNSLSTASFCCDLEGHLNVMDYCNKNRSVTGVKVAVQGAMMGATTLSTHWNDERGFGLLDNPQVRNPDDIWQTISVDQYDYLVLQPYQTGSLGGINSEAQAMCHYADLALSKGVKPIFICIWEDPSVYDRNMAIYDSVYNMYKNQGALLAPLFTAHKFILEDGKGLSYLYIDNDWYHHENENGVYVMMCVFYRLFTGLNSMDYNYSNFRSTPYAEANYLEQKAEEALDAVFTTAIVPESGIANKKRVNESFQRHELLLDLTGRSINPVFRFHSRIKAVTIEAERQTPCIPINK